MDNNKISVCCWVLKPPPAELDIVLNVCLIYLKEKRKKKKSFCQYNLLCKVNGGTCPLPILSLEQNLKISVL